LETNKTEVQETEQALIEAQNVYQKNQKRCEELDGQIEQLDIQLRDMKNRSRQTKDEERFVQAIQTLQTNFTGVYGRLQDLCSPTQRKYSTAVTVAAGKDMDAIVVSNSEVGFECIKYLREQRIGIATFLPLDKIQVPSTETMESIRSRISSDERYRLAMDVIQCSDESIQRAVLYAVGTTVICDELDSARELCFGNPQMQRQQRRHAQPSDSSPQSQIRMKAVTLGGAVISKAGTMTGGNSSDDQSEGRWKNKDLEKLRAKKEELEGERSQFDQVGTSSGAYASQIEQLRTKLGNLKNREQYTKSEYEYTKKTIKEKEVLLQSLKKQLSRLQKKVSNAEKENEKCSKAVKDAAHAVKAAEDVHLAPFREATGLRDLNVYETTVGQYRDEYQKKKRAILEHITQLEQQKEFEIGRDLKQPIVKVEERIRERTDLLQKAEKRRDELQKKIKAAKQQCEDAEEKYQKAVLEEKDYEAIVQNIQSEYTEAQNATMKYKKSLHQEESMLEKLRSKLHETLQRARVDKVELPLIADNNGDDTLYDAPGGRSTRSSRRGSSQGQRGESETAVESSDMGTATQDTSSRGLTQYSQEDHPMMIRDQEKASQLDYSKLRAQFKRRVGDRDEKKLHKDFEDKIQKLVSEIESIAPNMKVRRFFVYLAFDLRQFRCSLSIHPFYYQGGRGLCRRDSTFEGQ
jgi:structural maintenance of chromosome 1